MTNKLSNKWPLIAVAANISHTPLNYRQFRGIVMRTLIVLLALGTAGCAVVTQQAAAPQVLARYSSERAVRDFAQCAANAMERKLYDNDSGVYIFHQNGMRLRARWDFAETTTGSVAELRGPADYDAGSDLVKVCALAATADE